MIEPLLEITRGDAREEPSLGIGSRRVADLTLLLQELIVKEKRVAPIEDGLCTGDGRWDVQAFKRHHATPTILATVKPSALK
jgi:hypothetical protein